MWNVDAAFQNSGFGVDSGAALRGDENRYDDLWEFLIPLGCDEERKERGIVDSDIGVQAYVFRRACRVATVCIMGV
jgi:hypothetical protein